MSPNISREEILIHTFMLARSNPLTNFVDGVIRINPGRAYYTDSHHLGEHIVVEYLQRKKLTRGAPPGVTKVCFDILTFTATGNAGVRVLHDMYHENAVTKGERLCTRPSP